MIQSIVIHGVKYKAVDKGYETEVDIPSEELAKLIEQ